MSSIIRISETAKQKIAAIAKATGSPMTDVVDDAVDALERRLFMAEFNERYSGLRADPEAWAEVEAERRLEEGALGDDVD